MCDGTGVYSGLAEGPKYARTPVSAGKVLRRASSTDGSLAELKKALEAVACGSLSYSLLHVCRRSLGLSRNLGKGNCVTSPKIVSEGSSYSYCISPSCNLSLVLP